MIIDSHVHIGKDIFAEKLGLRNPRGQKFEQSLSCYLKKMEEFEIEKAIVFPFPSPKAQWGEDEFWYKSENTELLEEILNFKGVLYFLPAFNPRDKKSVSYALSLLETYDLKGLKLHTRAVETDPSKIPQLVFKKTRELDKPLVLHIGKEGELERKSVDISLNAAMKVARKNPGNRFVFTHLGRLHKKITEALKLENVVADTAALSLKGIEGTFLTYSSHPILAILNPKGIISRLVEMGYEDKLLWGSDEPYGLSYISELEYIKENDQLDKNCIEKLLYKNAREWFGI